MPESHTETVVGVHAFLLHQEVHGLCEALVVTHSEGLHTAGLAQAGLDLLCQLAAVLLGAGMVLEMFDVFYRHLDDLSLLNPAAAFLQIRGGDESAKVCQTVVHTVSPPLLYNSV